MIPLFKNLMFNMIKTVPEKIMAGIIYFSSVKKVPGFLNTIRNAETATTNNMIMYQ